MDDSAEKYEISSEGLLTQLRTEGRNVESVRLADADKSEWQVSSIGSSRRKGDVAPWIIKNSDGSEQNVFVKRVVGYEAMNEVAVSEELGDRTYKVLSPQNLDSSKINLSTNLVTETIVGYTPLESMATYRNDRYVINDALLKGVTRIMFECREKGVILFDAKIRNFGIVTEASLLDPNDDGIRMLDFEHATVTGGGVTPNKEFLLALRDFFWTIDMEHTFRKNSVKKKEFDQLLRDLYDQHLTDSGMDFEKDFLPAIFIGAPGN